MLADITGKILDISQWQNQSSFELQINGESGVYFVTITLQDSESETIKIVKTK